MYLFACTNTEMDRPVDVTVCEVAADPRAFDGQLVRMRARIYSDGRHHSRLADDRCATRWIPIDSRSSGDATNIRDLKNVLFGKESGTLDREIHLTVVGRVRSHWMAEPRQTIELVAVSDIEVKRLQRGNETTRRKR